MRKIKHIAVGGACALLLTLGVAAPASATSTDDALERLVELNAGATSEDLSRSIEMLATSEGLSFEAAIDAALAEAEASASAAAAAVSSSDAVGVMGSPGGGSFLIGNAINRGDVFVTPAWTGPVNHGHVGIYWSTSVIVEAPGIGRTSHSISTNNYRVAGGSVKQSVGVSQDRRNAAANIASGSLVGKAYNPNFVVNRDAHGRDMNCSQLVWAAYIRGANIDLDGNGGSGVYPFDIRDSGWTSTYRTF